MAKSKPQKRRAPPDRTAALRLLRHMSGLQSREPLDTDQVASLLAGTQEALGAMMTGHATQAHALTLVNTLNISLILCEQGLGSECVPQIHAAQDAMLWMRERHRATGRYGFDGQGLRAMQAAVDIYDQQLSSGACTEGLLLGAVDEVKRRINAGNVTRIERVAA